MSCHGLHVLYAVMNRRDDWCCERAFAPWIDMERLLREYPPEPYLASAQFGLSQQVYAKAPEAAADGEGLTAREREVLALLAEGLANKAIAARLGISEHTAKFHVNAILAKLGAESRSAAIVKAARLGLVAL